MRCRVQAGEVSRFAIGCGIATLVRKWGLPPLTTYNLQLYLLSCHISVPPEELHGWSAVLRRDLYFDLPPPGTLSAGRCISKHVLIAQFRADRVRGLGQFPCIVHRDRMTASRFCDLG